MIIFAIKNKKARELSDSGSEKEDNTSRATKVKKKKREKEKKKKREKEKMKRTKRRRESDSSEEGEPYYGCQPRKPPHSPPASVDSSPVSKLTPSHKSTSSQRSTPLTNSSRSKNPPNPSPQSSSSRSPLYYGCDGVRIPCWYCILTYFLPGETAARSDSTCPPTFSTFAWW